MKLKAKGYVPDTLDVAFDINEEERRVLYIDTARRLSLPLGSSAVLCQC